MGASLGPEDGRLHVDGLGGCRGIAIGLVLSVILWVILWVIIWAALLH